MCPWSSPRMTAAALSCPFGQRVAGPSLRSPGLPCLFRAHGFFLSSHGRRCPPAQSAPALPTPQRPSNRAVMFEQLVTEHFPRGRVTLVTDMTGLSLTQVRVPGEVGGVCVCVGWGVGGGLLLGGDGGGRWGGWGGGRAMTHAATRAGAAPPLPCPTHAHPPPSRALPAGAEQPCHEGAHRPADLLPFAPGWHADRQPAWLVLDSVALCLRPDERAGARAHARADDAR